MNMKSSWVAERGRLVKPPIPYLWYLSIPHISHHRHHRRRWWYLFCTEYAQFWSIWAILSQVYALFGALNSAVEKSACNKILLLWYQGSSVTWIAAFETLHNRHSILRRSSALTHVRNCIACVWYWRGQPHWCRVWCHVKLGAGATLWEFRACNFALVSILRGNWCKG